MGNTEMIEELAKCLQDAIEPRIGRFEQELQSLRRDLKAATESLAASVIASQPSQSLNGGGSSTNLKSLKTATHKIQEQNSQPEVLQSLADNAALFAPRVLLMVIKGTNALGWIGHGFADTITGGLRNLIIPLSSECIIRDVVRLQAPVISVPEKHSDSHLLLDRLGRVTPKSIAAVPLLVRGKVAGVLYADSGDGGDIGLEALEMLSSACGLTLEIILLGGRKESSASTPKPQPTPTPTPSQKFEMPASNGRPPSASSIFAQTNSGPFDPSSIPTNDSGEMKGTTEVEDAQRIARLLVQELVLYNQQPLAEGRKQRDIYSRLRDDIDRSRAAYDRRVSPKVAHNFFYNEMVSVLGEGDPGRLGQNCPGPRATVN